MIDKLVDVDVTLRAKNSSGEQTLHLTADNGEYWFTLVGKYEGSKIQIDFDEMTRSDFIELRTAIDLILEHADPPLPER